MPNTTDEMTESNNLPVVDKSSENELMNAIANCKDRFELQKQMELFSLHQAKKNAVRAVKMDNCLGLLEDQIISRVKERPDQISNTDLLKYLEVVSNHIDRATEMLEDAADTNKSNRTIQNTEVNINLGTELSKDNKENVVSAVKSILAMLQNPQPQQPSMNVPTYNASEAPEVEEVAVEPVPIIEVIDEE